MSRCWSCEGRIVGRAFVRSGDVYCCVGCADGGPCVCDYDVDLATDRVDHLGLPFGLGDAWGSPGADDAADDRTRPAWLDAPVEPAEVGR